MPRYRDGFPRPRKEIHHGAWRIAWRWGGKKYVVTTGLAENAGDSEIEILVRDLARQLACNSRPELSELWKSSPGVARYLDDRFGIGGDGAGASSDPASWLEEYGREIAAECSPSWAKDSIARLRRLETAAKGLDSITSKFASQYLADIAAQRSAGTRNRALITFSRFFKWAIRTGRASENPFAGISQLPEPRRADIIYCTPDERAEVIALACGTGWPDWMAIPIAFYSGMRREELSRLEWPDVRFSEGLLVVQKSKTGKSRVIPLAATLEEILQEVPENRRRGPVVAIPDGLERNYRLENLVRHVRREKRDRMLAAWALEKPAPSRAKEYRAALEKWRKEMMEKEGDVDAALERIGWNPFRHTFGSLLAQAGVSIDKISSWMGNTPEVCRRHYAQFIPRDRRDSEIDKL